MANTVCWRESRRLVLTFVLISGFAFAAGPVLAGQSPEATIEGRVVDDSGAVLPGVTVTVASPALQVKQVVEVTNAAGEYRVSALPLGTYSVTFELPGFQNFRREDVRLTAGFVARVDVALKVGNVQETVVVSGVSPVVDVTATAAATVLTREVIETIPTGRNGLASLLTMAPGSRGILDFGHLPTDPIFRNFGRNQNAWILVDGVAATGPWSGASGLGATFDYDSVEEATVQTIGSSAESPTSGIQISTIMKSGSNTFHGGGSLVQFQDWMQSNNVDDELIAQGITLPNSVDQRWDRGAELGGRIIRDKLWFYGNGRHRMEGSAVLGLLNPDGSQFFNEVTQTFLDQKTTYQLTATQKLIGTYNWLKRITEGGPNLIGGAVAYESRGFRNQRVKSGKIEWQFAKNNKFLSFQIGHWKATSGINPSFSDSPSTRDQLTGRITGAEGDAGIDNQYRRWNDWKATMNWYKPGLFMGNHDFKAGANSFVASGEVDRYDRGTPGNYTLIFRGGVPFQLSVFNAPAFPQSRLPYLAMYLQDSWTMGRRLTLNLGVRYAHDSAYNPEQCRVAAPAPFQTLYPAECFAEARLKTWNPVVPRLHAAYDVTGDGKTVLKGGWGRFAVMHSEDELLLANPHADLSTTFTWRDLNNDLRFQPGETNLDRSGPDFVSTSLSINSGLVGLVDNPDLKETMQDEFSVSLERELIPNLGVRVSGIYSRDVNTYRLENTLRPYSSYSIPITNPDPGRDGTLGTADDPGTSVTYFDYPASLRGAAFQRPRFFNHQDSNANYKTIETALSKRLSSSYQFMVAFSATKRHIPFVNDIAENQKGVSVTTFNPNAEVFAEQNSWDWQWLVNGSYNFPLDVQVSANYEVRSGDPWARTVSFRGGAQIPSITLRVEPIGTQRLESVSVMTLRVEKAFRLLEGHRIRAGAQIYNLFNENFVAETGNNNRVNLNPLSGPNYARPNAIARPRIGEVFLKYTF